MESGWSMSIRLLPTSYSSTLSYFYFTYSDGINIISRHNLLFQSNRSSKRRLNVSHFLRYIFPWICSRSSLCWSSIQNAQSHTIYRFTLRWRKETGKYSNRLSPIAKWLFRCSREKSNSPWQTSLTRQGKSISFSEIWTSLLNQVRVKDKRSKINLLLSRPDSCTGWSIWMWKEYDDSIGREILWSIERSCRELFSFYFNESQLLVTIDSLQLFDGMNAKDINVKHLRSQVNLSFSLSISSFPSFRSLSSVRNQLSSTIRSERISPMAVQVSLPPHFFSSSILSQMRRNIRSKQPLDWPMPMHSSPVFLLWVTFDSSFESLILTHPSIDHFLLGLRHNRRRERRSIIGWTETESGHCTSSHSQS